MVSTQSSNDWLTTQQLVYDRHIHDNRKRVWSPRLWDFIRYGIPLILLWGVLGVYVPVLIQEVRYQARMTNVHFQSVFPRGSLMPSWSWEITPSWVVGYSLEIPKLGIQEPIIENVDAGNKLGYMEALTRGVAHAGGTAIPGHPGVQYYFAHSSGLPFWGNRAVTFATLYKLDMGDEIIIYHDSKKYRYTVFEKKVVSPEYVDLLSVTLGEEQVALQTCWPLGTNWKRLLVMARRV